MDEALDPGPLRRRRHRRGALFVDGKIIPQAERRDGARQMHDRIRPAHQRVERRHIAEIARDNPDVTRQPRPRRIARQRHQPVPAFQEFGYGMAPGKAGGAGDGDRLRHCVFRFSPPFLLPVGEKEGPGRSPGG